MIKRYRHWLGEEARHMVETFDGEYVLYTDHLAAITEKDREIEQLKQHSCPEYVTMCNCTRCGGFAPKEYEKEDSDGLGD